MTYYVDYRDRYIIYVVTSFITQRPVVQVKRSPPDNLGLTHIQM